MNIRRIAKWLTTAALLLAVLCSLVLPASAAFRHTTLYIHGKRLVATPDVCRIGEVTYVPLRPFVEALDDTAEFSWNQERQTATVTAHWLEIKVPQDSCYIIANGRYLYGAGKVKNQNGSIMVPLAPMAKAFGVEADWDPETETAYITGEPDPINPDWAFYNEDTLYWLSRIVYSEAGIEELEGQIAVAQVVLNRVASSCFPSSVYDVIFDNRGGVQFSPTANGTIYQDPSREAVIAAKLALDGADVVGDSCYFMNPDLADEGWFERNCEYVTTIGGHRFYREGLW